MKKYITFAIFFTLNVQCFVLCAQKKDSAEIANLKKRVEQLEKNGNSNSSGKSKEKLRQTQDELKDLKRKFKKLETENSRLRKIEEEHNKLKKSYSLTERNLSKEKEFHELTRASLGKEQGRSKRLDSLRRVNNDSISSLNVFLKRAKTDLISKEERLKSLQGRTEKNNEFIKTLELDKDQLSSDLEQAKKDLAPYKSRNRELANFLLDDIKNTSQVIIVKTEFTRDLPKAKNLLNRVDNIRERNLLKGEANKDLNEIGDKLENYINLASSMQRGYSALRTKYSAEGLRNAVRGLDRVNKSPLTNKQRTSLNNLLLLLRGYCKRNSEAYRVVDKANYFSITHKIPAEAKKEINNALSDGKFSNYPYIKNQLDSKKKSGNISKKYNPFPKSGCN